MKNDTKYQFLQIIVNGKIEEEEVLANKKKLDGNNRKWLIMIPKILQIVNSKKDFKQKVVNDKRYFTNRKSLIL